MEIKRYGKTDAEKLALKLRKSRDIVREIMNFGVDQQEIIKIIELLSLEIENRDHLLMLTDVVKEIQKDQLGLEDEVSSIVT